MKLKTCLAVFAAGCFSLCSQGADGNTPDDKKNAKQPVIIFDSNRMEVRFGNYAEAAKVFDSDKDVMKLIPLSEKDLEAAKRLHDFNRFPKIFKPRLEEKPGFFHPSAEAPNNITDDVLVIEEQPQDVPHDTIEPHAAVQITKNGIFFLMKSGAEPNAMAEFMLQPDKTGKFGNEGVHFILDLGTNAVTTLSAIYDGTIDPAERFNRSVFQTRSWKTADGGVINTVLISWQAVYRLTGDFPLYDYKRGLWRLGIFRWSNGRSYTLRGVPYDPDAGTFLMTPEFNPRIVTGMKAEMFESLLGPYYTDPSGKGNEFNAWFGSIEGHYKSAPYWQEYFKVPKRLAYTHFRSNFLLCDSPGMIEDYKKNTLKTAQDAKELLNNPYAVNMIMKYDYERFMMREKERENLRFKAMSDRVFSNKFTEE